MLRRTSQSQADHSAHPTLWQKQIISVIYKDMIFCFLCDIRSSDLKLSQLVDFLAINYLNIVNKTAFFSGKLNSSVINTATKIENIRNKENSQRFFINC